jgi:trehalose 6-phosphate synthase
LSPHKTERILVYWCYLSSLAGAAQELSGALLVNPYDNAAVALALRQALAMPLAERRSRQESMLNSLRTNTISDWHESFIARLTGSHL